MTNEPPMPKKIEKVYDLECCSCHEKMSVNPSIFMTGFGWNTGSGTCLNDACKLYMHLWIEDGRMKSEPYEDYVVRMREGLAL